MPWTEERRSPYFLGSDEEGVAVAELYLTSRNLEASIDQYLLENGVMLDTRTRAFLANIREVMGAVSRQAKRAARGSAPADFN